MELLIGLLLAIAASITPVSAAQPDRPALRAVVDHPEAPRQAAPAAPSQGELTQSAIDLFIYSKPSCKVADFEFIVKPRMVVATCDAHVSGDFAGMFLIDGHWQPGIYDTGR